MGSEWRMTRHALERAEEFGATTADVIAIIENPEVSYTNQNYTPMRAVSVAGDLAVVTAPESHTVVTVLRRTYEHWEHRVA